MNLNESIIYQIYPLGLCGCPKENDGNLNHRILHVLDFVSHIKSLGANTILFNPLFESDKHGYDTRDYNYLDCRLGTNDDLKYVCQKLKEEGFNLIFDGVFNHVGRGFWAFRDVIEKKWDSPYKDWFNISFDGNTVYNDGFYYEAWEGHYELVKLNLYNPEVKNYLFDAIRNWLKDYNIDGLRLDVAYCLNNDFLRELRHYVNSLKNDFVLIGETLHGDYNRWMNNDACHSATNYETYKGIYSSFNSSNMHEIAYSLNRQFGSENWCLYTNKVLMSFIDNHDVSRIKTILNDKNHLLLAYSLIMMMPGFPAIYYGSEWGVEGDKKDGDDILRPYIDKPIFNELTNQISNLINIRLNSKAIKYGSYKNLHIMPKVLVFERIFEEERIIVAINADYNDYHTYTDMINAYDLINKKDINLNNDLYLKPYSINIFKINLY